MLVCFNEKGKEYLRVYSNPTEEQLKNGIEVEENDIPDKEGFNTVLYLKNGKIEYSFEENSLFRKDTILKRLDALEESLLDLLGGEAFV